MAVSILLLLVAIFIIVNTLNGNLPGLVNVGDIHPKTISVNSLQNIQSQSDVNLTAIRNVNTQLGG